MTHKENISKRTADCVEVEMRFDGNSFIGSQPYNSDFNVHHTELMCSTDEEWEKIITSLRKELVRRKAEAESTIPLISSADEITSDEIRIIGDVKYQVVKTPCHCPCHSFPKGQVKHVRACCNGGYQQHLIRIKE
jgi:hypothetical protein